MEGGQRKRWLVAALVAFWLAPLGVGAFIGNACLETPSWPGQPSDTLIESLANWDGRWYLGIVQSGYAFTPDDKSNAAFFPAYPLSVSLLELGGLSSYAGAPLLANLAFIAGVLLTYAYARIRFQDRGLAMLTATAVSLCPAGCFFRMAYSESMFLVVSVLFLYLSARKTAPEYLAIVCGLATAVRPVGVVLLAPLLITLWNDARNVRWFLLQAALLAILATWGILLFTAYQWDAFGDPFAWMRAQSMWRNTPAVPWPEKIAALATLKPIWASYIPGTEFYWRQPGQPDFPLFSLRFMNPIFFVAAVALVWLGGYKRWLNAQDLVFSAGLLAIPYVTRGYDMCMESQARFTSVVFPMYMVVGILLSKVSRPWQIVYFAASAFLLCAYTACFTAGYVFI